MLDFAHIVRTLDTIRTHKNGHLRSIKTIERFPTPDENSWSLEEITQLNLSELPVFKHVNSLYICDCRKLTSLSIIAEKFPQLHNLFIYSSDRLTSLDGLQSLQELQTLTIWPSFSGSISLESFKPLTDITTLRSLVFSGKCIDGSLAPLYGLKHLQHMFLSNNFNWEEFANFERHQPHVNFCWKGGVVYDANPAILQCKKCNKAQAMLTGRGKKLCCPDCDAKRLEKHLHDYSSLSSAH